MNYYTWWYELLHLAVSIITHGGINHYTWWYELLHMAVSIITRGGMNYYTCWNEFVCLFKNIPVVLHTESDA